jgi:3-oxoacyl-[acyl-carrier protein] reductase
MTDGPLLGGKVAVVTGGSRGLGRAIVRALAGEGADVAFSYLQDAAAAREVARAVERVGRRAVAVAADARSREATEKFVAAARSALGPVDLVVANAGVYRKSDWADVPLDVWRETLETNLVGPYELVRAARPHLRDGTGVVVLVGSISGLIPFPENLPSAAAKSGIFGLTRSLAVALAPKVRVNAVVPGWLRTDMTRAVQDSDVDRDRITRRIPRGRWGEPDDVAAAVTFLGSDGARFVTGETLVVDGGQSIRWTLGVE